MLATTMYFSYVRDARLGLNSKRTFDAMLAGERSSTTRFPAWPGYERWKKLKVGDQVRFYAGHDMKGRYVDVTVVDVIVIEAPVSSILQLAARRSSMPDHKPRAGAKPPAAATGARLWLQRWRCGSRDRVQGVRIGTDGAC